MQFPDDVSAGIIDKGQRVYSDFANHFGPIFTNRLSLLSAEIVSHNESLKACSESERNAQICVLRGRLSAEIVSHRVYSFVRVKMLWSMRMLPFKMITTLMILITYLIQQLLDNLTDSPNEGRVFASPFEQPCQNSCSIIQAAHIDDTYCPSTPNMQ